MKRSGDAMARGCRSYAARACSNWTIRAAATSMLRGMMIMEPQRAVMMGQREPPEVAEIEQRAKLCARLFLGGCKRAPA